MKSLLVLSPSSRAPELPHIEVGDRVGAVTCSVGKEVIARAARKAVGTEPARDAVAARATIDGVIAGTVSVNVVRARRRL